MRRRSRWLTALLTLLVLSGVTSALWPTSPIKIEHDRSPQLRINRTKPVEITYSEMFSPTCRGWGFTISPDARVSMSRTPLLRLAGMPDREEMTFTLPPDVVATLPELVEMSGILELHASYQDTRMLRGRSASVSITQNGRTKSVNCFHHFPPAFSRFERELTRLVLKHSENAKWVPKAD
jgi:hypothetical protein